MTGWEPATEAEIAMRDALRAGDQELYFRILARTELLLPVSAGRARRTCADGLGHLDDRRAYARARLHVDRGAAGVPRRARRLGPPKLGLPRARRGLAQPRVVAGGEPGLPIEGYLPAWFVSQLVPR